MSGGGVNLVGIMQGRLSPPDPRRLQAFPWASWEKEFVHAAELGLDCIEWLFEEDSYELNPIWTQEGVWRINELVQTHGVSVNSVCADYFMMHPFFRVTPEERAASIQVLKVLITQAASIGAKVILIPVLEVAEIRLAADAEMLGDALQECLLVARENGIHLGLETELPADEYAALTTDRGEDLVGVYYDTGNAAAKGYDTAEDIRRLAHLLCGIHVKDRMLGGGSVPLGEGAVDFPACFAAIWDAGYRDSIIMQPFFASDFLRYARRHLDFVRRHMGPAP